MGLSSVKVYSSFHGIPCIYSTFTRNEAVTTENIRGLKYMSVSLRRKEKQVEITVVRRLED
jgi:hypothetical protein